MTAPAQDLLEAAAEIVALVAIARGTVRDEHAERVLVLERAVIAATARGELDAWDRELVDAASFGSAGRELAWLCAVRAVEALGGDLRRARVTGAGVVVGRRGRPWDVARLWLLSVPRGLLSVAELQELLVDAGEELDAAERAPRVVRPLELLLAERRRAALLDLLLPAVVALDAGQVPPDVESRLRAALGLVDGADAPSRRAA